MLACALVRAPLALRGCCLCAAPAQPPFPPGVLCAHVPGGGREPKFTIALSPPTAVRHSTHTHTTPPVPTAPPHELTRCRPASAISRDSLSRRSHGSPAPRVHASPAEASAAGADAPVCLVRRPLDAAVLHPALQPVVAHVQLLLAHGPFLVPPGFRRCRGYVRYRGLQGIPRARQGWQAGRCA